LSKLLVVEDDPDIAEVLRTLFTRAGHEVRYAAGGRAALREAYDARPDLVILDIGLPEMDGWSVLERLRDLTDVPVLMLTAHAHPADKVRGLRSGADDYLTKPFSNAELVARVEALLRRSRQAQGWESAPYDDGVVHLDPIRRQVYVHGTEVRLTPTEFRLLNVLVRNAGAVLTPAQLLANAWDDPTGIAPSRVKFAVMRLRRKLDWSDVRSSPLESIRSVGYRYRKPGAE
jgi:DNA-binding response OmpR family regulator